MADKTAAYATHASNLDGQALLTLGVLLPGRAWLIINEGGPRASALHINGGGTATRADADDWVTVTLA